MLKKLRRQFILINMSLVTAILLAIFAGLFFTTKRELEAECERTLDTLAYEPLSQLRPGRESAGVHLPYFILQTDIFREIWVVDGGYFDLTDEDFIREVYTAAESSGEEYGRLAEYDLRFRRILSPLGDRYVFADVSGQRSTLEGLARTCLLIGAGALALFFVISLLLARRTVRPVETAWQQQKQFVSDASHELKTPLTVITTNAELLADPETIPEDKERFAENILATSRAMRSLVEGLLQLARLDNGSTAFPMEDLDLSACLEEAVLPFEPVFFEEGRQLRSEIEGGICVHGHEGQLRQLADILLDNARKYSLPGSETALSLRRNGKGHVLLTVASPGAPISEEDTRNIFKRFYRADTARVNDGSYGLGLPIALGIAERHKGKLWCESRDGLNAFYLELTTLYRLIETPGDGSLCFKMKQRTVPMFQVSKIRRPDTGRRRGRRWRRRTPRW